MELVCYFMELDELVHAVNKVYGEVKKEKRTLVEATVVAKLALDTADALTAQVQLKYPTLRTSLDMHNVVRNIAPEKFRLQMAGIYVQYMTELEESIARGDGTVPYVQGMFLADFVGVANTLEGFTSAISVDGKTQIVQLDNFVGEAYGEERTPDYVRVPDPSNLNSFLIQQLVLLHNSMVALKTAGVKPSGPMDVFLMMMEPYFTTRVVTVPVVFTCICWMKSVAALQGDGGLGRNVSLTFKHSVELARRIDSNLENRTRLPAKAKEMLERCSGEKKQFRQLEHLARANPIYAGLLMLEYDLKYLYVTNEVILSSSTFCAFGHLYNALVKEGYLERIPILDDVLQEYEGVLFTPSRYAATHGAYHRSFLYSRNIRPSMLSALYRGETPPAGKAALKQGKQFHLSDVSDMFRLMMLKDKSVLSGVSWMEVLDNAAQTCSKELFGTRVLSRDVLRLFNDLGGCLTSSVMC